MRNKIIAHMYEHTDTRVILADGPIARVETTNGPISLPLKSCMASSFDEVIEELSKHAVVYLWEVQHPLKHRDPENMIVRWGAIE